MTRNAGAKLRRFSLWLASPSLHVAGCRRPSRQETLPIAEDEMYFRSMEDRLNPVPPEGADESTLEGYIAIHGRSPGFTGSDGMPYTAAIEVEQPEEADGLWAGYLVFLRWAENSSAIMGHLETEDLSTAANEEEARRLVGELSLSRVKELLDQAIDRRARLDDSSSS